MSDIELASIPAGSIQIVDARRGLRRTERFEAFELGVFPVTEELVAELIGVGAAHPRRPAVELSWLRAVRLCNAASEWEGLDLAYGVDGEDVVWHRDSEGFRLPSEAEWEFACRAGSTGPVYGPLGEVAWSAADGVRSPQDVGARHPNLFGLFDTLGNVSEWCFDLLDPDDDPSRGARVFRGGGFADDVWNVRADVRRGAPPRSTHDDVGLRLARSIG
ncbi:formylglycine-generating enzyme family protein [Herbiconiux sp. CPCC 205716]|uniref:Formylglycine-generating enzyme family protein n=1 Tax=Herbiconiux gentiana TaxID=2970912 RepID=A0ABT2GK58_9MICO|nr:formylglycine-generating enzyme family protein [Herbiconiux gentiana]MCS5715982.1 formylglycine-generating enzyme family protein [Herbiconiux gentiana]